MSQSICVEVYQGILYNGKQGTGEDTVFIFIKYEWVKEYSLFYVIQELWDIQSNCKTNLKANKWTYFSQTCIKPEFTDAYAREAYKVQINSRKTW